MNVFILKRVRPREWSLSSEKTQQELFIIPNCSSTREAMQKATVWASSWESWSIKVVDEHEKVADEQ